MSDLAHFNTGVIVHQAGDLSPKVIPVALTGNVLLRLTGGAGDHVTLADTPLALHGLLTLALAHLEEHLPEAEAAPDPTPTCVDCGRPLELRYPTHTERDESWRHADVALATDDPGWADSTNYLPFYCEIAEGSGTPHHPRRLDA